VFEPSSALPSYVLLHWSLSWLIHRPLQFLLLLIIILPYNPDHSYNPLFFYSLYLNSQSLPREHSFPWLLHLFSLSSTCHLLFPFIVHAGFLNLFPEFSLWSLFSLTPLQLLHIIKRTTMSMFHFSLNIQLFISQWLLGTSLFFQIIIAVRLLH